MSEILKDLIVQFIPVALELVLAIIGGFVLKYIKNKFRNDESLNIIKNVVRATEQIYIDIHGGEKLRAAEKRAKAILESKGIYLPDIEITTLIESAVHEMNLESGENEWKKNT